MKKNIILLITFLLIFSNIQAQSSIYGSLNGTIIDADTKEPLPGANIIVMGTMLGTISDLKGNFSVRKIPPGKYNIKATMMGYKSIVIEVQINSQAKATVNFNLKETVIETPTLVVTAGKKAQSFQDVPNSISLVTAREIERKNRTFLNEILEYTPGVNVTQGDVNIRGSSGFTLGAGSRVLLLVDGIPMMPGDSGDIKWDIIPLSQIERVEVVKGAGSALYGSYALGGVINIISKEPSEKPFTEIKLSSGIYDKPYYPEMKWTDDLRHFNQADITFSHKWKKIGYLISGGRRESTGYQQNGNYLKLNLLGRLDVKFDTQKQLTLQSSWSDDDRGEIFQWRNQHDALEMPVVAVGDKISSTKFSLNGVYRHLINQKFTYKIRTSYFKNYWKHYYHDSDDYSRAHKLGLEIQGDYILNKTHSFTFGFEGVYDITKSAMFGDHDGSNLAGFFQDEIHLGELVTITAGFRYDYHYVYIDSIYFRSDSLYTSLLDTTIKDNQFNPKLGFTIKPSLLTTIRASVGRGFRTPTMAEMFTETNTSGFNIIPNPVLKAERAWSYEIGINQVLSQNMLLDIAVFHNDYWNFIEPERDDQNTVQFINVDRARIRGLELMLQSGWWKRRINAIISYTLLDPQDITTGKTLAYRPKHLLSCSINFNYRAFQTGLDYRYVSRLDTVKVYPTDDRVAQKVLDGRVSYTFNQLTVSANINNMLNYNFTQVERNLAPIRNYVLSLAYKF